MFQDLIDFFNQTTDDLVNSFMLMAYDLVCLILDIILNDVVILMLSGISTMMNGINVQNYINMIPNETLNIMQITGFPEAIGIIITGLSIRLVLNLIPFVKL